MVGLYKIESALEYFRVVIKRPITKRPITKSEDIVKISDVGLYQAHLSTAQEASAKLGEYSKGDLEYLTSQGFRIDGSVIAGVSQNIINFLNQTSTKKPIQVTVDDIEQILRLLVAYSEILPYESSEVQEKARAVGIVRSAHSRNRA